MALDLIEQLNGVTSSLYAAVFDESGWGAAVSSLRDVLQSDHGAIGFIDHRVPKPHALLYGDCEPEFERLYHDVAEVNPFMPAMRALSPGGVVVDGQMSDRGAFENSAFYNLWMRPQTQHSGMVLKVASRDGIGGYFMASRGGRSQKYSAEEVKVLAAVGSTLTHALGLYGRFSAGVLEQTGRVLDGRGLGWMAVEPGGRIVWSNSKAEALLGDPSPVQKTSQGKLSLSQPRQMRQLQAAIHAASVGNGSLQHGTDIMATHLETGGAVALSIVPAHNLFVQGLPAVRGAYIAAKDLSERLPAGFEDRVRSMFDLTPKEALLAAALASGQPLASAAAARAVSMATARSQLSQIFRKTGTSQQSQLVSLLLSVLPIL